VVERIVDVLDADAHGDGQDGGPELAQHLNGGAQAAALGVAEAAELEAAGLGEVVDQADENSGGGAGEQARRVALELAPAEAPEADGERGKERHAAQGGDGPHVHAAGPGLVDDACADTERAHRGRQAQREQHADHQSPRDHVHE